MKRFLNTSTTVTQYVYVNDTLLHVVPGGKVDVDNERDAAYLNRIPTLREEEIPSEPAPRRTAVTPQK